MVEALSDQQLKQLLTPLCSDAEALVIEPVRKGLANVVYHAQGMGISWAVKLLGPASFSPVDYINVQQLQQQLADLNIAPRVINVNLQHRIWVEEWIDTAPATLLNTDLLAQALAKIHSTDIDAPTLALLPCWQHYLEQLPKPHARQFIKERDELALVISQASDYQDFCFCHNDLSFAHLVGRNRNTVIDWEYAATGNRYFDLAACVVINELNEQQCQALCEHYALAAGLDSSKVYRKTLDFLPVVNLTNRLWQAAADQQS